MRLQEQVPAENVDAMHTVTRSTGVPICRGENLYFHRRVQFPGIAVPLAASGLLDHHHPGEYAYHKERFYSYGGQTGYRRRTQGRDRASVPVSGDHLVQVDDTVEYITYIL